MIKINSISKSFGKSTILTSISACFNDSEITGIIGASGSGKSLLAKCMVGLETADSGMLKIPKLQEIKFPIRSNATAIALRKNIVYVSQTRSLPPYKRIIDLVSEGPRYVLGFEEQKAIRLGQTFLDELNVGEHSQKYPTEVSGGELSRICMARALAIQPKYIICDEIFSNLDPEAAENVGHSLLKVQSSGVGVILITHQLGFLKQNGHNFIYIRNGTVWERGSVKERFNNPNTKELDRFISKAHNI